MQYNQIMNEDEIICRCEEITLEEIKKAIKKGAHDTDSVKRMTRAGMGLCQNKACYNLIARIISRETGKKLYEILPFKSRPPVRPIKIKNW
jgi:NAD(P)H-nitrite reductase large subunit